jgi:hypothetical protein
VRLKVEVEADLGVQLTVELTNLKAFRGLLGKFVEEAGIIFGELKDSFIVLLLELLKLSTSEIGVGLFIGETAI